MQRFLLNNRRILHEILSYHIGIELKYKYKYPLPKVTLGNIIANLSKSVDFEATEPADYNYCELIASDFLLGENCQHVGNTN